MSGKGQYTIITGVVAPPGFDPHDLSQVQALYEQAVREAAREASAGPRKRRASRKVSRTTTRRGRR